MGNRPLKSTQFVDLRYAKPSRGFEHSPGIQEDFMAVVVAVRDVGSEAADHSLRDSRFAGDEGT
jgi:hypothetical protein